MRENGWLAELIKDQFGISSFGSFVQMFNAGEKMREIN